MKHIVAKRNVLEWTTEYCVFEVADDFDPDDLEWDNFEDGHRGCIATVPLDFVEAEQWEFEGDATEDDLIAVATIDLED